MRLVNFLRTIPLRRRQRRMVESIQHSRVQYSDALGKDPDNPIVITGAQHDMVGTMAILAWLIDRHGTMNADWRIAVKSSRGDADKHIDVYTIELRSGERETYYFDVTESFGMWPSIA